MDNKILVKVKADITDLNQKLDASAEKLDSWSKDTMGGFTSLAKSIGTAILRFAAMTAPITAAGAAIFAMMQKTANTGEELHRMRQKTGLTVEELYNLKQVAEFSDVSLVEMGVNIKMLSMNLVEARSKAGQARDIFKALDIDISGSLNQVIMDLAKRFAEMEDGEGKLALATQLFGRNGQDIIPVLNDLASGAHKVAGSFSEKAAKAAGKFNNNITELKQNVTGLVYKISNGLIPTINDLFALFKSEGAGIEEYSSQMERANRINEKFKAPPLHHFGENTKAQVITPAKKAAPIIITDEDRKKYVDNEQNMAKLVDDAGQKIIDNLNKRAAAYKKLQEQQQTAREAAIQLQLKELDLSEQEFRISKSDAVQERVRLYAELQRIQEEYIVGLDKINDPASWYAQMNAINDTREALVQLNLKLKEQTGTFTEGFSYGFQKFQHDAKTSFEYGQQLAGDTANAIGQTFENISFDAMQSKLKTLGDYFRSLLSSIQSSVSNILGQLITQLAIKGLTSLFGGLLGGGMISSSGLAGEAANPLFGHSGGYIPRFHAGGLSADEVPAILQRGEYVINRNAVAAVGRHTLDGINRGDSGKGGGRAVSYNITIQNSFLDPSGIEKYKEAQERQIHNTIKKLKHENKI